MDISLALPVHNGANYLREALESAVAQGEELAEIVVADNCSTDGTASIIAEFAARDPRVRHERSEKFLGQADNVTRSVRLCRQGWVQLLCHDDLLLPGAIRELSRVAASFAGTDCCLIAHRPAHLFSDGHVCLRAASGCAVTTLGEVLSAAVPSAPAVSLLPAPSALREALARGAMPYLPSLTTAAVRRDLFESSGGFDARWVHFDVFHWLRMVQANSHAVAEANWTLTRVHGAQVAVHSRRSQRSYRDFRDFFREFVPEAVRRYSLSPWAAFKLRLKPASQAAAPLVVAIRSRNFGIFCRALTSLPPHVWPLALLFCAVNYFREARRNAVLWRQVPPELTYE
ncbi:MAG: hypothetical protein RJA37_907 [Verrucomicrobiota bacterium]|jgi:glycosyltransferase involved in cell wall biosynthesis